MTASALWARFQRPLILLAMQSCWLYAWIAVIEQAAIGDKTIATATVLLLVIGAAWRQVLGRFVHRQVLGEILYWVALPLIAAVAAKVLLFPHAPFSQSDWLLALPRAIAYLLYETRSAELLIALGSAAAWYLGRQFSGSPTSYESLLGQFQLGIVMLFGALLVGYGFETPLPQAGILVLGFFAISLAGIASARSTQRQMERSEPTHVRTSVVTLVVIVSGIGILIGAIATPGFIEAIAGVVRHIMHLLGEAIAFLASLLPQPEYTPTEPGVSSPADDSALREFYESIPVSEVFRRAMFIMWTVIVLGMLLVSVWRLCSVLLEWLRKGRLDAGEERESLDNGFLADILALLNTMRTQIAVFARRLRTALAMRFGEQQPAGARSLYLRFTAWAGKRIARREPWQSPYEYMATLMQFVPDATPDLVLITDSYVQARYGAHEPAHDAVVQMEQAIARVRKAHRVNPTQDSQEGLQ